jgi:hypothetical protein
MHLTTGPAESASIQRAGRGVRSWTAAAVLFVLSVSGAGDATAAEPGHATLTVDATVVTVMPETSARAPGPLVPAPVAAASVGPMVQVGGSLYPLPVPAPAGTRTGDHVVLTLDAAPGLSVHDALDVATAPGPSATASIVGVARATAQAPQGPVTAEMPTGVQTLLVLPVDWTAPDAASQASLTLTANATAAYWNAQSGTTLKITTDVRDWKTIANPGSCANTSTFASAIFNTAMAANGETGVASSSRHILVYFPNRADCGGWAGLGSIGGGNIWINGANDTRVVAHELGHNLGLGHSNTATCTLAGAWVSLSLPVSPTSANCTLKEYGDQADVMGSGFASAPAGNLNTGFADFLGYARGRLFTSSPPAPTSVELWPLGNFGAVRSIKIPIDGGTVYIDYRPEVAPDTAKPAWAGVQVHYLTTSGTMPVSYLLDMQTNTPYAFDSANLPVGGTWDVPGTSIEVRTVSTGATAIVSVGPSGLLTPIESYITRVYRDLFFRSVDPGGLQNWATQLATGTPRIAVANAITSSAEYRSRLITESYRTYLHREPDAAGLRYWLWAMSSGLTIQGMEAGFLASPEYYLQSGSTDGLWVQRLYADVLGRAAAQSEVDGWVRVLGAGADRGWVALGFLLSTEHLTTVVDRYYQDLLGRGIDPSGQQFWVTQIQSGVRVEAIVGSIIASDEYFARV